MIVEKSFYIGFRMVDDKLNLKSGELLNIFTDIAGIHSERVGYKFGADNCRWLLVGYSVKIFEKPKYTKEVLFRTWSRDYNSAFAIREFEVLSDTGAVLAVAMCHFVRYNIVTGRLEKITDEGMNGYISERDRSNFNFEKLKRFVEPVSYDGEYDFMIDWRWIDLNRHLNNSHYVDLAERIVLERYGVDVGECNFDVTYKAQVREGVLKCMYLEREDSYVVSIKSEDGKTLHGAVTFYKR